jgi:hypothetical protein
VGKQSIPTTGLSPASPTALWAAELGLTPKVLPTITYLENNQKRMHYPEYRRQGLPVTTAWMESLVKEVNYRVKGTEMFWNNPEGAEADLMKSWS